VTVPLLQAITRAMPTYHDQRKTLREHVQFPAWIDVGDGEAPRACTVLDVSEDGARIMLQSPVRLPRTFDLLFNQEGTRRRPCRMVWRVDEQVGVNYAGPLVATEPLPSVLT
jgi:hypothetical protein